MNMVVLEGRVGGDVKFRTTEKGQCGIFTLWHNPENKTKTGESFHMSIVCFGGKVDHVLPSLKKSDLIQVLGKLKAKSVNGEKQFIEIEAFELLRVERFKRKYDDEDDKDENATE